MIPILSNLVNPFFGSVISDPWKPAEGDVPEIHAKAFLGCVQAGEYVQKTGKSTSIIIHGEAGSGKTHLMARLRSTLDPIPAVFISIPLQTGPHLLWRHIRRCLVDDLLRPATANQNQFAKIIAHRLEEDPTHFEGWLYQVRMDHDLFTVLNHFLNNRFRRETRAWLRGDSMTEADLDKINLPIGDDQEEEPEDKSRRVVLGLCRLFGPAVCLIVCFDQVEALQSRAGERTGLGAFGKIVQALHDGTDNLLIISCMQSSYLDLLYDAVDKADQDRLASYGKLALLPLTSDQALVLIANRLDGVPELAHLRQGQSRLWPLNESDIHRFYELQTLPTVVARQIIAYCVNLFEAAKGRPVEPIGPASEILDQLWQARLEIWAAKNTVEDSDPILQYGLPALMELRGDSWQENQERSLKDIDFIFSNSQGSRIEISLCNHQNMTSLAARLKRLSEGLERGDFRKLVLMRDPRRPIPPTAKKTNETLEGLKQRGVRLIHPPLEVLAALDALRGLLAESKAGDLSYRGRGIEHPSLRKWLDENMPAALQEFMEDLTAAEEDPFPDEALLVLLEEQPLWDLKEAAHRIQSTPAALEAWVRKHPRLVGLLNGPPALLFQIVPEGLTGEFSEVLG